MVYKIGQFSSVAKNLAGAYANIFSGTMERAKLTVQLAMAERQAVDMDKINAKYDGSKERAIEKEVTNLFTKKNALAEMKGRLDKALGQVNDVRVKLYDMKSQAEAASSAAFDLKLQELNSYLGSSVLFPDRLTGNPGQGYWNERTTAVETGIMATSVSANFLGNDYVIDEAGGDQFKPDFVNRELKSSTATIGFDSLTLNSLVGDAISFTDGTNTYNGTLRKGGLGLMSGWMYNNFATQADIDQASADVGVGIKEVLNTERSYRTSKALIETAISKLQLNVDAKNAEYKTVSTEQLTAKQAERRAITQKYDFAMNSLSLTANVNVSFIQGLFNSPNIYEKKSVFGVLRGRI